jgi:sugar/nucleoside kinase (ribokinase family)
MKGLWKVAAKLGVWCKLLSVLVSAPCHFAAIGWRLVRWGADEGGLMVSNVLCVGRNSVDFVFEVDLAEVRADAKQRTSDPAVLIGGQCVNAAVTLAALGASVTYAGVIGGDDSGKRVLAFLKSRGISTGAVEEAMGLANPCAYILVDRSNGERSIVETAASAFPVHSGYLADEIWATTSQIYFDGNETAASIRVAHEARQRGVPTTTDVEVVTSESRELLSLVETAIVPKATAIELAGSDKPADMLAALVALGGSRHIVTMGEAGAIGALVGGEIVTMPATKAHVIDTTGAGDAFHAGFLFADMGGASFARAMEFATRVAALACEYRGPSADEAALAKMASKANRGTWIS